MSFSDSDKAAVKNVADTLSAANAMRAQVAKQTTEVRDHLMEVGQAFDRQSVEKSRWIHSSRYAPTLMFGAVVDGDYNFSAHDGRFVFSAKVDGWGSWSTFELSPEDAVNFADFLERQFQLATSR